jgi:hypothetical protein
VSAMTSTSLVVMFQLFDFNATKSICEVVERSVTFLSPTTRYLLDRERTKSDSM